jgi:hypothetical protein
MLTYILFIHKCTYTYVRIFTHIIEVVYLTHMHIFKCTYRGDLNYRLDLQAVPAAGGVSSVSPNMPRNLIGEREIRRERYRETARATGRESDRKKERERERARARAMALL